MKNGKLKGLARWMGRQGRPGLWAVCVLAVLLHLVLGVHLLRTHPFVPFRPICYEDEGMWTLSALQIIDGEMSVHFYFALKETFFEQGIPWRTADRTIYIRFVDWWDDEMMWNMTSKAVGNLIEERQRSVPAGVKVGRETLDRWDTNDCAVGREMAVVGGKWEFEGPP